MPSVYDRFNLVSDFTLAGDQERAIGELVEGLNRGDKHQVLLGVTGSGKTFTMAQTIARVNRPALVMVHNKTLAAQLFQEFRRFFPDMQAEALTQTLLLAQSGYHAIEFADQSAEFISAAQRDLHIKLTSRHGVGGAAQLIDRLGDRAANQDGRTKPESDSHCADEKTKPLRIASG